MRPGKATGRAIGGTGCSAARCARAATIAAMDFSTLPELPHELVRLRPLRAADIAAWAANLMDPVVHTHTSWNVRDPAELASYAWTAERGPVHDAVAMAAPPLRIAIARRDDDALVGTAGFHSISPLNRSLELAYDLAPIAWGKGIATTVARTLVDWAQGPAIGALRVQATVLDSNVPSQRVLGRSGFAREGLLRSFRMVRGRPGDFWMYAHVAPFAAAGQDPTP